MCSSICHWSHFSRLWLWKINIYLIIYLVYISIKSVSQDMALRVQRDSTLPSLPPSEPCLYVGENSEGCLTISTKILGWPAWWRDGRSCWILHTSHVFLAPLLLYIILPTWLKCSLMNHHHYNLGLAADPSLARCCPVSCWGHPVFTSLGSPTRLKGTYIKWSDCVKENPWCMCYLLENSQSIQPVTAASAQGSLPVTSLS